MSPDELLSGLRAASAVLESTFGSIAGAGGYGAARWLFLRALALIYLIAFTSLWVQVEGLMGERGILPVGDFLAARRRRAGGRRWLRAPTLFWLGHGDRALHGACAAGIVLSVLLFLNVAPALSLLLLWALYLSFAVVGGAFLSYQWDVLLLEAGFLAIFLAPWDLAPGFWGGGGVSALAVVLMWWLLFRLVVQSGVGKLTSGDPTWRGLTALRYHYFTQPLPTWTAWHAHQLPDWFHRASTAATLVLEAAWPLLIFGTREMRLVGFGGIVFLQLLILATGNYNFFNLLTLGLALLLLDDGAWSAVAGAGSVAAVAEGAGATPPWPQVLLTALTGTLFVLVGGLHLWRTFLPRGPSSARIASLVRWIHPFRTINSYGLFRVMTTRRREIVVQGSRDGEEWRTYRFRFKPCDPADRPRFVEPHQPRLDWQMWFAALSTFRQERWFRAFLARLLEGSGAVLRLLRENPFPDEAPRFVRALFYDYRFTSREERKETGKWWRRRLIGTYAPAQTRAEAGPGGP